MIKIENNQVFSSDNKFLHRLNSDLYFKKSTVLPFETINDFEEVDEIPAYTKSEYDEKVNELIRERYTESEEFALQRKMMNTLMNPSPISTLSTTSSIKDEYFAYNQYCEECKVKAKDPELYKKDF